jgi:hypothetical protein
LALRHAWHGVRNSVLVMKTITWTTTDLTANEIETLLGKDHVAWIKRLERPADYCESRAYGWWQANERESYAAYRSLARLVA